MTPKLLNSFLVLAEIGNVSRSAAKLHLTQPALSRQMSALEADLGVKLFDRNGRGMGLTEAGVMLREKAAELLHHIDDVRELITASEREPQGTVAIGLPMPLKSVLTWPLIEAVVDAFPKIKLKVFENSPVQIRELLANGLLDFGVLSSDERGAGLLSMPFVTERLFIAGSPQSPIDPDAPFDVERLVDYPLVQASPQNGVTMVLNRHFAKAGKSLSLPLEVSSSSLMVAVAATGKYMTVLPYSALAEDIETGRIIAAPLTRLSIHWAIARRADSRLNVGGQAVYETLVSKAKERIASGAWKTAVYEEAHRLKWSYR